MQSHHTSCAALYLRASTEHQNYSTSHQEAALREYAEAHDLEVRTVYRDEGRSGLTLDGRHGLLQLLTDVQSGAADFDIVLVYDVSRWGRFQDVDESAYYEYACRKAGIDVAYCAEPFANDGSALATILKGLKRAMAAEFIRELSAKVHRAQCRLTAAGFKQGGSAGYGLRRLCISATGEPKRVLEMGERKSVPSDRVTFVHGPADEVAVVRRIFSMCCEENLPDTRIADCLNSEGLLNQHGRPWSSHNVKSILTNEKYTGTLIYNRSTQRMRSSRRPNDTSKWIRVESAFEAIVSCETFEATKTLRRHRGKHWTNDEMLDGLRDILVDHGKVTAELINQSGLPSAKSYAFRFRGLVAAYEEAGVSGPSLSRTTIARYRLRCVTKDMSIELERCALMAGAVIESLTPRTYRIRGVVVRILCTRCRYERSHPCWKVTLQHSPTVDFVIWFRMDELNEHIGGIYLLPTAEFPEHQYLWPSTLTLARYQRFSYPSVQHLFGLVDQSSQGESPSNI
ncbi:recombinase family protein [Massilia pinisoli]|uniref:Recombinase family protein n=1 Tax=Massilia pinisoli TaxID=1772194 RepID=A0ABT1ZM80_9BURK|nr:recombinase family protein [Massilia pinisoli]MCS0581011.1 recombinase family protein [Massilia pinisoli]